jgi:arylsulfatase A-like enzyme
VVTEGQASSAAMPDAPLTRVRRGLLRGAAYGLAVTLLETWAMAAVMVLKMHIPAMPGFRAGAVVATVLLGSVVGVLLTPLLALRRGALWHSLALAAVWIGLGRAFTIDADRPLFWVAAPALALGLIGLGTLLARVRTWVPVSLGLATVLLGTFGPLLVQPPALPPVPPSGTAPAGAPDVVVVVLDTVRADHVSAYGYGRATTPALDALAEEGALFMDAMSPSTWSLPSHASLFTGQFPSTHKAVTERMALDAETPTLASVLAQNGYQTGCFSGNPHISDSFGLTRGFAYADEAWKDGEGAQGLVLAFQIMGWFGYGSDDKGGRSVVGHFSDWFAERPEDAPPAFAFLNFLEAHFPFHQVPEAALRQFTDLPTSELQRYGALAFRAQVGERLSAAELEATRGPTLDMYDAGVRHSDDLLLGVVDAIRAHGDLDNTVLVVLSDHGEMIGEHGNFGHGVSLYDEDLRVPLLIRFPPAIPAGARVAQPVSTVGVYATVMELAHLTPPGGQPPGSLLPALDGQPTGMPLIAERFGEFDKTEATDDPMIQRRLRYRVYRSGDWKLAQRSDGRSFLYDLGSDPGETTDLSSTHAEKRAEIEGELADWTATLGLPPLDAPLDAVAMPEMDPAAQERLRALGYIE